MARALVYDYTFNPSAKQITLRGNVIKERLLIITNTTTGDVIYNFADPSLGSTARTYSSSTQSTTYTLEYDTTSMSSSDNLSIFIDNPAVAIEPSSTYTDPVSKFRVSEPQTLIDTDFEYGLQPTKWETLELVNNTPSFFSRSNDTTIPNIQDISTLAGSRIVTVTCTAPHGLTPGIPIDVRGTREVTCDGTYIIDSTPTALIFKYLAKVKQSQTRSIYDVYSNINVGQFFTGSNIQLSNVEGIVTDASTTNGVSTLTLKSDYPHGFGINTPLYLLNLNTSITKNFDGSNSGTVKAFDGHESTTARVFNGSNQTQLKDFDTSNSSPSKLLNNTFYTSTGNIERTFNSENNLTGGQISYTVLRNANKTYNATDGSVNTISNVTSGSGFTGNGVGVAVSGGSGSQLEVNYEIQGPISTITNATPGSGYTNNYTNVSLGGGSGSGATANITTRGNTDTVSLTSGGSGYLVNATAATTTSTTGTNLTVNYTANGTTGNQSVPATPGAAGTNVPAKITATTTSIVKANNTTFTISYNTTDTYAAGTYIRLSGVTPSVYNQQWIVSSSSAGSVTVTTSYSIATWVDASVQGTITFYGDKVNVPTTTDSGGSPSGLTVDYFVKSPINIGGATIIVGGTGATAGAGVATTCVQGNIRTLGTIAGGTGYVNGTYFNIPLTTSTGSGSGAIANIVISGGSVNSVSIINPGTNYTTTSVLSVANLFVGGSGSGFTVPVSAVGGTGATVTTLVSSTGIATTTFGGTVGTFTGGSGATYDGVYENVPLSIPAAPGTLTGASFTGVWGVSGQNRLYVQEGTDWNNFLPSMWVSGTGIATNSYIVSATNYDALNTAITSTITSVTSTPTNFTVTHASGYTVPVGSFVRITGATPNTYNSNWIVATSTDGSFTVNTAINPGTATVLPTMILRRFVTLNANLTANIGASGSDNGGTATFSSGSNFTGTHGDADITVSGGTVTAITIRNPGNGYNVTAGTANVLTTTSIPGLTGGTRFTFRPATLTTTSIYGATIVAGGSGYRIGDILQVQSLTTRIEVIDTNTTGTVVSSLRHNTSGTGYDNASTITVTAGAITNPTFVLGALSSGSIRTFTTNATGSNYSVGDTFTVSGGTSAAQGSIASIRGGQIVGISLTNSGSNYRLGDVLTIPNGVSNVTTSGGTIASTASNFTVTHNTGFFATPGAFVTISGSNIAGYNRTWQIATVPNANTFTVAFTGNLGAATGVAVNYSASVSVTALTQNTSGIVTGTVSSATGVINAFTASGTGLGTNQYTNIAATGGTGTGATFNVRCVSNTYTVTLKNGGSGYVPTDTLTIPGTSIGGLSTANDISITINGVNCNGFGYQVSDSIVVGGSSTQSTFTVSTLKETILNMVSITSNVMTLSELHNYSTGSVFVMEYTTQGTAVTGLTVGTSYWVRANSPQTVSFFTSYANASANTTPITIGAGAKTSRFTIKQINQSTDEAIRTVNHGFSVGDFIRYTSNGTVIAGLTSGQHYWVKAVYGTDFFSVSSTPGPAAIQSGATVVNLTGPGAGQGHTFFSTNIDVTNNYVYNPSQHGLTDNIPYYFSQNASTTLNGMTTLRTYYIRVVDVYRFYFVSQYNSTTSIDITDMVNGGTFAVSQAAVDTFNNEFWIPEHRFSDQQSITYNTNGGTVVNGLTNDTQYYVRVLDSNRFYLISGTGASSSTTRIVINGPSTAGNSGNLSQRFIPNVANISKNTLWIPNHRYNTNSRTLATTSVTSTLTGITVNTLANISISAITSTSAGFTVTHTSTTLEVDRYVFISGVTPSAYNGIWKIGAIISSTQFTVYSSINAGTGTVFGTLRPVRTFETNEYISLSGFTGAVGGLYNGTWRVHEITAANPVGSEQSFRILAPLNLGASTTQGTITLNDVGKPVLYSSGGGTAIGGLVSGRIYYVNSVTNDNEIKLSATPGGAEIDLTSTNIQTTHTLKRVDMVSSDVGTINAGDSSDYFYVPSHGFTSGTKINFDAGVAVLRVSSVSSGIVTGLTIVKRGIKLTSTTYTNLNSNNGSGLSINITLDNDGRLASISTITNGGTNYGLNDLIYIGEGVVSNVNPSFLYPTGLQDLSSSVTSAMYYARSLDANRLQISSTSAATSALALNTPSISKYTVVTQAIVGYGDNIITFPSNHGFIVNEPVLYSAGGSVVSVGGIVGGSGYTAGTCVAVTGGSGQGLLVNTTVATGAISGVVLPPTTSITSTATTFTVAVTGITAANLPIGSSVLIQNAVPAIYNGRWIVASSTTGSFTVNSTINPGTATTQGTISTGSGYKQGDVLYITGGSPQQSSTVTVTNVSVGSSIAGLVDGNIYYVRSVPTTTTLTLSATQGGSIIYLTDYGTGLPHSLKKVVIDDVNNLFYIPQHGFITNQPVTYSKSTANFNVRGLTDGQIYYVNRVDENKFSLLNNKNSAGGSAVDISGAGSQAIGSTHIFTSTPVLTALDQLWIPNHGFTTGDAITYNTGGGAAIASPGSVIINLGVYFAIKIDGDYISLASSSAFAEANTSINITAPGTGTAHNFVSGASKPDGIYRVTELPVSTVYRSPEIMKARASGVIPATVKTVDPRQIVDPDQDLIRLTSHGFTTGTTITYSNNGNTSINGLTHNTTYYVIAVNRDFIRLATSASNAFAGIFVNITGWGTGSTHFLTTYQINGEISASGTVSTSTGTSILIGSNTLFTRYLKVGDDIKIYPIDVTTSYTPTQINIGSTGVNPGTVQLSGIPSGFDVGDIFAFQYNVSGVNAITGLTSGYWYFARVISTTTNATFSLYNTISDAQSQINGIILTAALPAPASAHTFSYISASSPILRTITAIASDTSLTVDTAYNDTYSSIGYTFPTFIYVRPEGYNLHRPYDGGVEMNTGSSTSDGDTRFVTGNCAIVRQTRKYFRYQSGKGIQVSFGINFQPSTDISVLTSNGLLATAECRKPHGLTQGSSITIFESEDANGSSSTPFNGSFNVNLDADERKFTVNLGSNPSTTTVVAITNNTTFSTGTLAHPYYVGQPITFATTGNGVTANTTYYVVEMGNDGSVDPNRNNTFRISLTGGTVSNFSSLTPGSGYTAGTGVATTGGSGTGLTINTTVDSGTITNITINNGGNGYKLGDIIYIGGSYTVQSTFIVAQVSNGTAITSLTNGTGLSISTSSRIGVSYGYPKFYVNSWVGSRNRAGLFDVQNGMFFEFDGSKLSCVRRSSTQQISGTLSVLKNSNLVIGDGTLFTKQLDVNSKLVIRGQVYKVTYVLSDTQLTIAPAYRGNNGNTIDFDGTLYKGAQTVAIPGFTVPVGSTIGITGVATSTTYNGAWTVASSSSNSITVNASGVSGTLAAGNGFVVTPYGTFRVEAGTATASSFTVTFSATGEGYSASNTVYTNTAITSTASNFTVTVTSGTFTAGQYVSISGATPATYNGTWRINSTGANSYTVLATINPGNATVRGRTTLVAPVISRVPYSSTGNPFTLSTYGAGYTLTNLAETSASGTFSAFVTTTNGTGTGGAGAATFTIRSGGTGYTNGTYNNVAVLQAPSVVVSGSFVLSTSVSTYTLPSVAGLYPGMRIKVTGGAGTFANTILINSINVATSQVTLSGNAATAGTATQLTFWSGRQARVQARVNVTVSGGAVTAITPVSTELNGVGYSIITTGDFNTTLTGGSAVYIPAASIGGTSTNPAGFSVATVTTGKIDMISVWDMGNLDTNGRYMVGNTITLPFANGTALPAPTATATFSVNSIGSMGNGTGGDYIAPSGLGLSTTLIGATTSLSTPAVVNPGTSYNVNDILWVGGNHTAGKQSIVQVLTNKINVDILNDTINITAHGLTAGQPIIYNAGDGNPIGGLLTGNIYYVIYKSIDQFQLSSSVDSIVPINLSSFGSSTRNRIFPSKTTVIASLVVDTKVSQDQWNLDKCDGRGQSGYILDLTKMQMAYLDYSWYGAGKARFGFKDQNGMVMYAHEFVHNNKFLKAYMRSGNMPCRYEVENLDSPTYSPSISHWGTSVIMDGKFDDDNAYLFTATSQNLTIPQTFPKQFYASDLNITANDGTITIYNHAFANTSTIFQATISSPNNKALPSTIPNTSALGKYTQASGQITSIISTASGFTVNGVFGLVPTGHNVTISGASVAAYNGNWTVASSSTNSFTVLTGTTVGAASPTGTTVTIGGVWARVTGANTIKLYNTEANAVTGTTVGVFSFDAATGNGVGGTNGIFVVSPYLTSAQSYYQPLLSVRLSPSVDSGLTGGLGDRDIINRMQLRFKEISVTTNFSANIRLLLNANLSNLSFSGASAPSLAQILQHGSSDIVNNGVVVYEFRAPGGGGTGNVFTNTTIDINNLYELGNSIMGGNAQFPDGPDILTIAASRLEFNTNPAIINSKFSWTEAQA